ncbi:MAG: T9SS type A sorting domain-containing protein [Bacteroidota bacterium]|nr:T9SS type A sorting domain-containing protein [Bacteroidota bacterium]
MKKLNCIIIYTIFVFQFSLNAQTIIKCSVLANGASSMSSNNINLVGTVGQTVINNTSSSSIKDAQGFWYGYQRKLINSVATKSVSLNNLSLFPNPVSSNANLKFNLKENSELSINIINLLGIEVKSIATGNYSAGEYSMHFDMDDLSDGLYLLFIYSKGIKIKLPFLKVN